MAKTSAKQLARGLFEATKGKTGKELDEVTEAFVQVLKDRHELSRWREVIRALDFIWKAEYGAANVEITSAHELPVELIEKITKAAGGASVTTTVNKEVIGGASIRIDDRIVDATLATRLETLKQQLS